ncbi:hypothetical protein D3C80_1111300 [compost metagenome]
MVVSLRIVQWPPAEHAFDSEYRQRHDADGYCCQHASSDGLGAALQIEGEQGDQQDIEAGDDQQCAVTDAHPGFGEQPAHGRHDQHGAKVEGNMGQLKAATWCGLLAQECQQALVLAWLENACLHGARQVLGVESIRHGDAFRCGMCSWS